MSDQPVAPAPEPVDVLSEGLLSPGTVRLFGRPYNGLTINDPVKGLSRQNPLAVALAAATAAHEPVSLARIYAFTYLGNYFKLAEPLVFLVFGAGTDVPSGYPTPEIDVALLGVEVRQDAFARGLKMWPCDALDVALRIDVRIGWIKDLLLTEMSGDNNMTGGSDVRRSDLVGRDGANMIGRDANLVGRDANLIGRDANLVGRSR